MRCIEDMTAETGSPQPQNLAWNNVEAVQNLDLALGGRDNRAVLVWGAGNRASLGRRRTMEHRWFYEIIGFVGMAPVILLTLRHF
jgi:hypothetical protein